MQLPGIQSWHSKLELSPSRFLKGKNTTIHFIQKLQVLNMEGLSNYRRIIKHYLSNVNVMFNLLVPNVPSFLMISGGTDRTYWENEWVKSTVFQLYH